MGKESFEDKIRQQLEGYEAPYDKSYWKKYARSYPAPRTAFWKLWWMPYAFSSLLFGLAWFWFGRDAQPLSSAEVVRDTVVVNQTIVTRDTLVVRDTVVLVWNGRQGMEDGGRTTGNGGRSAQPTAVSNQRSAISNQPTAESRTLKAERQTPPFGSAQGPADSDQQSDSNQPVAESQALKAESNQQSAVSPSAPLKDQPTADSQTPNAESGQPNAESQTLKAEGQKPTAEEVAALMDSIEQAAIAEIPTEPESKLQDAGLYFSAGPRLTVFSPLNYGNFDTRFGSFVGGAVQIDWRKWQLEVGLQYGVQLNEIDELTLLPLAQLQQFPGYTSLGTQPDEVGVLSEHLLLPLQARYTVYDYRAWRIQVAGGALGNAVLGETFIYDNENVDRELWERTTAGRGGLSISHLNAGVGTSYQWRQNLELQAILNYYHPLRPLGLNRLDAGALSLQLGLNWLLLPR